MPLHIRLTSAAAASQFADAVNTELGYPIDGVDIGPGIHAPPALSRTLGHFKFKKHPTLNQWEYPWTDRIQKFLDNHPNLPGAASRFIEDRTDDWDDPPPGAP